MNNSIRAHVATAKKGLWSDGGKLYQGGKECIGRLGF